MYSEEDLNSAVAAGVLTDAAAAGLRKHAAERRLAPATLATTATPAADEEPFRLVTGFNDIFVVIACLLMVISASWIGNAIAPWVGPLVTAVAAWLLAEFFVRKRRMALPAIVLLLLFVGGLFTLGFAVNIYTACALCIVGATLHWWRFRVPITIAAGVCAVLALVAFAILRLIPGAQAHLLTIFLLAGVAAFALALWWDAGDTLRQTRRSDVAFWLHLLAAPLLVHPIFTSLKVSGDQASLQQIGAVVILYIGIAIVSLAIDRRALMVSALAYVLYAFSALLKQYGMVSLNFAITAGTIGAALLLLSAYWQPSRAFVLGFLPAAWRGKLAPLR
jgi:branched-subunit amino acid transport protein AzlD